MQKIAIPILDHKLSPNFVTSPLFKIYLVEDETIVKESLMHLPSHLPESLPVWLAKKGVTDIITRRIGHRDIDVFNQHKINVFVGVLSDNPDDLVQEYINGTLETHDDQIVN
jgi:predicted Fe-Mo cluster-binding NifX family protein